MTRRSLRRYQSALEHSSICCRQDGPFHLIDMQRLTEGTQQLVPNHNTSVQARHLPHVAPGCCCSVVPRTVSMVCSFMMHSRAGCGDTCTNDGIHYINATYDAALQIWSEQSATGSLKSDQLKAFLSRCARFAVTLVCFT